MYGIGSCFSSTLVMGSWGGAWGGGKREKERRGGKEASVQPHSAGNHRMRCVRVCVRTRL